MTSVDRREFGRMMPALLAVGCLLPSESEAQTASATTTSTPLQQVLPTLRSGTFKPGPATGPPAMRVSHRYVLGMLAAGNIQLEMHETIQQPGAVHEAIGTHKHNELWMIQRGVATLFISGTEHRMEAGDVGLVCAGDTHWIGNGSDTELAYFVVTVGPPE